MAGWLDGEMRQITMSDKQRHKLPNNWAGARTCNRAHHLLEGAVHGRQYRHYVRAGGAVVVRA